MGIYSSAYLTWGVPILAYDDEGEPTPFWDEESEDWREFEGLTVEAYGHYEDPDNTRAILSIKSIPQFSGDCWTPKAVGDRDLDVESYHGDALDRFIELVLQHFGDDGDAMLNERGWYLVASLG
jgi:hypothetical protein